MKRNERYQDTTTFTFFNANPKNRFTTDCVIRAISAATTTPYNQVVMDLATIQCETGYDDGEPRVYGKYLENLGWTKRPQPRKADGSKYTGAEFCRKVARAGATYVAHLGGHHIVAIVDKKVLDTWDCTTKCIGNYWVKESTMTTT